MNDKLIFDLALVETKLEDAIRKLNASTTDWTALKDLNIALSSLRCTLNEARGVTAIERSPVPHHKTAEA